MSSILIRVFLFACLSIDRIRKLEFVEPFPSSSSHERDETVQRSRMLRKLDAALHAMITNQVNLGLRLSVVFQKKQALKNA